MKNRQLTRTSVNLVLLNLAAFMLSILLQLLIAKNFGTTRFYDIFSVAYTIPSIFGEWLLAGASTIVMVPLLCHASLQKMGDKAWSLASTFINLLLIITMVWILFWEILSPHVVPYIVPGFDAAETAQTVTLTRILVLGLFFTVFTGILRGIYNANAFFSIPVFGHMLSSLSAVVVLAALVPFLGTWALVLAMLSYPVVNLLFNAIAAGHLQISYRVTFLVRDPDFRVYLKTFASFGFIIMMGQTIQLIDRYFASYLPEGSISLLAYVSKFELPFLQVIAFAVAVPSFTLLANEQTSLSRFRVGVEHAAKLLTFYVLPLILILVLLRLPITSLWLQHGTFKREDTFSVATLLLCLSPAIVIRSLSGILVNAFFALKYVRWCLLAICIEVVLKTVFNALLIGPYGVQGIAAATTLSILITNVILWTFLSRKLGGLDVKGLAAWFARLLIPLSGLILTVCLTRSLTNRLPVEPGHLKSMLLLVIPGTSGLILFLGLAYRIRIDEATLVTEKLSGIARTLLPETWKR